MNYSFLAPWFDLTVGLAGQLSQAGVSMGGFGMQHQSSGLNSGIPISHSVPTSGGPSMYASHYGGLNSLGNPSPLSLKSLCDKLIHLHELFHQTVSSCPFITKCPLSIHNIMRLLMSVLLNE
jgi:hypothetical protein